MEFSEDQLIVLEIIKGWLDENDAAYLAKEDIVVHWGNPTGDIQRQDWVKYKCSEIVNIIRATQVPVGVMKHCTTDMFKAACQEEERTYICGVEIAGDVKPEYFNYTRYRSPKAETVEHKIAVHLIAELHALSENIIWKDLVFLFEQALKYCGVEIPNQLNRNKFLRYGIAKTDFVERRANKDYNGRYVQKENGKIVQYTCIKLPYRSGLKRVWSKTEMRKIILKAVNGIKR